MGRFLELTSPTFNHTPNQNIVYWSPQKHIPTIPTPAKVFGNGQLPPGGVLQFPLNVVPGMVYTIEMSPDLKNWTTLETFTAQFRYWGIADLDATNYSTRFYRAYYGYP